MKSLFLCFAMVVLLAACSSPEDKAKKEVYELAVEKIKTMLKSPSSAKIQPLDEIKPEDFIYSPAANKGKWSEINPSGNPTVDSVADANSGEITVDLFTMIINVEAQNPLGVFIQANWSIGARYKHFSDGSHSDKWELYSVRQLD